MSSSFKIKNRKKSPTDTRITLDAQHNEKMKYFNDLKKSLPSRKKNLKNLQNEFNQLKEKKFNTLTDIELNRYLELKENIPTYQKDIEEIESNKQETDYLLDTGYLLCQYYDNIDNVASGKKLKKKKKKKKNTNSKSVIDFFQDKNISNNVVDKENTNSDSDKDSSNENKISEQKFISRGKILDEYLSKTDKDHIKSQFEEEDGYDICKKCHEDSVVLIHSEGILVCQKCGYQIPILIDSDKPSYKDPPREISYFAYKRINHFNEWLAQFQAKESTDIPDDVYNKILLEIKKERISDMRSLTPSKLREILKKLKLNKYYEHVPHIINRLNGVPPPIMSRETEEKLRMMFKEIQTPFMRHCPKDRKNFLSYSYVLHKFVQLLGLDEFLACFPLLKSREKLHQQDQIWKKICEDLKWEFIKSL
jgi:hypothetical protein